LSLVFLAIFDISISGLIDFIKPMLTSRSYLALTVGVLIFSSLDIALNDFLPSFINDLIMAMSVSSSCTGKSLLDLFLDLYTVQYCFV